MNSMQRRILGKLEDRAKELTGYEFNVDYNRATEVFEYTALAEHYSYQDQGVDGTKKDVGKTPFKYKDKMPPPSAFKKYTSDKGAQFAIAKSVQQKGIKPKYLSEKIMKDNITVSLQGDFMVEELMENLSLLDDITIKI